MKKNYLLIFILSILLVLSGCNSKAPANPEKVGKTEQPAPKTVIENNFMYLAANDKEKLLSTYTAKWKAPNVEFQLGNIKSNKIIDITETKDSNTREQYLVYGPGKENGVTSENLCVLKVKYERTYVDDSHTPETNGIFEKNYFLIRENKDAPWLIDEIGA